MTSRYKVQPNLLNRRGILRLVATGTSDNDIARQLFISSNTVKVHIRNIFGKIGVTSRTEAAVYAIHAGLTKTENLPGFGIYTQESPYHKVSLV